MKVEPVGEQKEKGFWRRFKKIFPAFDRTRAESSSQYIDVASQGSMLPGHPLAGILDSDPTTAPLANQEDRLIDSLPVDRSARCVIFGGMVEDPTISAAVSMHVGQSMSSKPGTGEIIDIESTGDADNPYVKDLRDSFKELVNKQVRIWAFNAATYGAWYIRPYGRPGKGVEHIRSDFYTHPRFIKEYEHGGRLAGYTHAYQNVAKNGKVILIEPWKFIAFKLPHWHRQGTIEPVRHDVDVFDIGNDDLYLEELVEGQDYGDSILSTAFDPWFDLQNAIVSLNMSRRNAARLERLIGVNVGRLQPTQAAKLLNTVAGQLKRANEQQARDSLKRGYVQTVINHLIPIPGERGGIEINTVEGTPNIEGLEDVMFHVKRLGGALGVDPSMIGFGDMLSGGLGEGGFFRMSIMSAIRSNQIRRAIQDGLEELFNIHIAYKFNKFFLPGNRPWRIVFNSVSTALEREEQETMDSRMNQATMFLTMVQTADPELVKCSYPDLMNYLCTGFLRMDEEKFAAVFPASQLAKPTPAFDEGGGEGGGGEGGGEGGGDDHDEKIMEAAEIERRFYERNSR